ncbi:hypothetical protein MF672_026915 [Actinomadura sp. ATCC 31491]|uniref:Cell wall-active antibiotics response LiaF-like C-terminal domain-containing protein n=1 Tax=Actinomadura luzonensis TaxID=2805427 RepID=A0ABT0FZR3_9ACTN|nr:hypothetical protein [Actinomadura luzonensis]MCK2217393.1 hypothetical protein [Actinomadura luzonensis]
MSSYKAPPISTASRARVRLWLGIAVLAIGCYLIGDVDHRLGVAWRLVSDWWPWAALGLAAINVGRGILRIESLLAPGLVAAVPLVALAVRYGVSPSVARDVILPGVLVLAGGSLALSLRTHREQQWTRVLSTGFVRVHDQLAPQVSAQAIVGELHLDLTGAQHPGGAAVPEIALGAVLGHVHLKIPRAWEVRLPEDGSHSSGWVRVNDSGTRTEQSSDYRVMLRLTGLLGVVTVSRR